jgi:ectoine hydroxylase-related dioxygenase (phytanoyl-CoA dioxygenase family)
MEDIKKIRARFKSKELDEQFEKDGYVIIRNCIGEEQLAKMLELFDEFYEAPKMRTNIWNTLMIEEKKRQIINERIMEQIHSSIEKHFYDYVFSYNYFLTKPVDEESRDLPLHSDASAVNEDKYHYLLIWLPLIDVDKKNGCIYMIPGSQKLFTYVQPFWADWPYPHLEKQLKEHALDLPMKAGDLLLFSPKTIHGSYPNRTNNPRPVVGSGLVHPDTEMYFHHLNKDQNLIKVYEVDFWFYYRNQFGEPAKDAYPLKKSFAFNPPEVTPQMVKQFFKENPVKGKSRFSLLRKLGLNL